MLMEIILVREVCTHVLLIFGVATFIKLSYSQCRKADVSVVLKPGCLCDSCLLLELPGSVPPQKAACSAHVNLSFVLGGSPDWAQ